MKSIRCHYRNMSVYEKYPWYSISNSVEWCWSIKIVSKEASRSCNSGKRNTLKETVNVSSFSKGCDWPRTMNLTHWRCPWWGTIKVVHKTRIYSSRCPHSWLIENYVCGDGSCGDQDRMGRGGVKGKLLSMVLKRKNISETGHNTEEIKAAFL